MKQFKMTPALNSFYISYLNRTNVKYTHLDYVSNGTVWDEK